MKQSILRYSLCILVLFQGQKSSSQQFVSANSELGLVLFADNSLYGAGLSFYDWDEDGLDDMTISYNYHPIRIYRNNGITFDLVLSIPTTLDAKLPTWIDYDQDGDNDLFITQRQGSCILMKNNGNLTFTNVTSSMNLPIVTMPETMGCSWGDYDQDSYPDVYICNYGINGFQNWLMHNNGNGSFSSVINSTVSTSKTSFQSVWMDINHDQWPDLYVINDRGDGNELYINNDGTNFTESSATYGLDAYMSSMSNSFCDFDRDGDFDLYISNTAEGNHFYRNENDFYTDVADELDMRVNLVCWSALWVDYDNNGWDDLSIATSQYENETFNRAFRNNGGGSFTMNSLLGLMTPFANFSSCKGDYNNDGYYDILMCGGYLAPHVLYKNIGGDAHYLKFDFEGTVSNRNAIGTTYAAWANEQQFKGYTKCGENYLSQNSQHIIIGLDTLDHVDSLIIDWPSGLTETYYNLIADTSYSFVEGSSLVSQIVASSTVLCNDGSIELSFPGWPQVQWTGPIGGNSNTILATQPGTYSVHAFNDFGFVADASITISESSDPTYSIESSEPSCYGWANGSIEIVFEDSVSLFEWTGLSNEYVLQNISSGNYPFNGINANGCEFDGEVALLEPSVLESSIDSLQNVSCFGYNDGYISFEVSGGSGNYLPIPWDQWGMDPTHLLAGEYQITIEDDRGCTTMKNFTIVQPPPLETMVTTLDVSCFGFNDGSVSISLFGGSGNYNPIDWNALNLNPGALPFGDYTIEVQDDHDCISLVSFSILEPSPLTLWVNVDTVLCYGETATADVSAFGGTGAISIQWTNGNPNSLMGGDYIVLGVDENQCQVSQPIHIEQSPEIVASIVSQNQGDIDLGSCEITIISGAAPFVVTWDNGEEGLINDQLEAGACVGTIQDVNGCSIQLQGEVLYVGIFEANGHSIVLAPNPASGFVSVRTGDFMIFRNVQIFDSRGECVLSIPSLSSDQKIDLRSFASGTYYFSCDGLSKTLFVLND